ncbi:TauD/TfdA family dioxygenase [Streptomyces sp. HSW2009]|uniref:TauD/TfdA family dioxygenase n=1 Tax=Streptomyces sp. HSW2009 TaxID=3142890 RepID=UPI0032EF6E6E
MPDEDPQYYLEQGARLLRSRLSATALAGLERWRGAPTPWLELDGLPQADAEVPTPRDGFCDESLLTVPNLVHFGLLRLLGLEPVAFRWENHGRLLRNVAPSAGAARSQTSWGYATELDWHTDDSVLDHAPGGTPGESIPHFLTFYGMRNTERVPTWLLPVDEVLAGLPLATISALHQPDFDVSAPESYASYGTEPEADAETGGGAGPGADAGADTGAGAGVNPAGRPPLRTGAPLLWTLPDGSTGLRYGPGRVSGRTPAARAALDRFVARVAGCEGVPVLVEAGGFHLFDNRRVMHRRLPFEPAAADRARWLRRCYARRSTA